MKFSRRTMLAIAGAGAALAQTPAAPPSPAPTDPLEKAREENRHSAQDLTQFAIPMSTEPAFTFRA